jgi:hypothetical protein
MTETPLSMRFFSHVLCETQRVGITVIFRLCKIIALCITFQTMSLPTTKDELAALFRQFGAKDPELWAASQVDEGIPQLARFLFMKAAWEHIPREGDSVWIDREVQRSSQHPAEPYAGLGKALALCRGKGVPDAALTEIARCLQAQMLFTVGYVIDGPAYRTPLKICLGLSSR